MALVHHPRLSPDTVGTLRHYARKSRSENTQRAYAAQWRAFDRWCATHGCQSLPAEPISVAAYLVHRVRAGAALATLNVSLAAVAFAHKAAGRPFDRAHPDLALVLAGIRREHVRPERQAEPLTGALVRQVLAGLGATPAGLRDGALLAVLYTAALRSSEAAALDWMQAGSGRGWLAIGPKYVEIVLLGSKASAGSVERVRIPTRASPRALRAIKRWVRHADIQARRAAVASTDQEWPGSTRPPARRQHRPHCQRVMRTHLISKGLAPDQAQARARRYTGHSARVGFCVTATEAGVPPQHIAAVARHRGLAMTRRYAKQADMLICAPHARRGVGV